MQTKSQTVALFPFRVTDHGEELEPSLSAADAAHARALVTAMYGGDVASRARIEPVPQLTV